MAAEGTNEEARRRETLEAVLKDDGRRSFKASAKYGKSLRRAVPRDVFAGWMPSSKRPNPVGLLFEQDKRRLAELVPMRRERMAASSFEFFSGAALVMASDLSDLPTTGIEVQLCGDAHVGNFGLFRFPDGRTVFDISDFDETTRGPWEWDVARLAASIDILGRDRGISDKDRAKAVRAAASGYRTAMRSFANMGNQEVWYALLNADALLAALSRKAGNKSGAKANKASRKAKGKEAVRAEGQLYEVVDGSLRIVSNPSAVEPLCDLTKTADKDAPQDLPAAKLVADVLAQYRRTLPPERSTLVGAYRGVDIARKVAGVESLGTHAFVVVLEGASKDDVLVLQVKEATSSVLERFVGKAPQASHGQRVVEGQRTMQAVGDHLLGWTSVDIPGEASHDFYVRQLWDRKGSVNLDAIDARQLCRLAKACGWTLAHAHARTGDRHAIAAYLGNADIFDNALVEFAGMYADQNERDYARWRKAVR